MVLDWDQACGNCLYSGRKGPAVVHLDSETSASWSWALPLRDSASNPAPATDSLHPPAGGTASILASGPGPSLLSLSLRPALGSLSALTAPRQGEALFLQKR